MTTTIKLRRGTAAEWETTNAVLAAGEMGVELDTNKHKIGDGTKTWTQLNYFVDQPALNNAIAQVSAWAREPDMLISGAVTRDTNGAATSAPVTWPDGTPGIYTADIVSIAFPGAVDAYHITYGSPVTMTYTQPAVTRAVSTGVITNLPVIVVS